MDLKVFEIQEQSLIDTFLIQLAQFKKTGAKYVVFGTSESLESLLKAGTPEK